MSRTSNVLAPASSRMTVADRLVAEYAPDALWVAEAPDLYGQSTLVGWRDHTGNGVACTDVTGTPPTLQASDSNCGNQPTVTFSGGYVETTTTFADTDLCLLVVFRDASVTGSYEVLVDLAYTNNVWIGRDGADANEWTCGIRDAGAPYGQIVTAADGGRPHALFLRRSGSTHDVWVDGKQAATRVGSTSTCTAATLKIGGGPSGGNLGGSIALVAKWSSAPTDAALQAMTRILRPVYQLAEEP